MERESNNNLTIGELAASAGVGVETIRFYQRRGWRLAEFLASPSVR